MYMKLTSEVQMNPLGVFSRKINLVELLEVFLRQELPEGT